MGDIRTSSMGGVPFGTSSTRPSSPSIGQTYYNGTLGVQEIYTSSGWLPATGANDFNVTLTDTVTVATFTKEYFAGAYTIASALLDSTYDIYVYDTSGNLAGYTKSPSLSATGNFNKIVVIGGTAGDLLSFSYKTTFTASATTSQVTAGAFITSATPTALNSIGNTTTVTGGNFATNVAVYFVGSDNVERAAKTVVRNSATSLTVTRPDNFPTNLGTYKIIVENPGVTRPTGSSLHILNNAITAGTTPVWSTSTTLPTASSGSAYSTTLVATDIEGTAITYSLQSATLPTGLSLNSSTGVLSGTPTSTGSYSFTIRATDAGGNYIDRTFTIIISGYVTLNFSAYYAGGSGALSDVILTNNNTTSVNIFRQTGSDSWNVGAYTQEFPPPLTIEFNKAGTTTDTNQSYAMAGGLPTENLSSMTTDSGNSYWWGYNWYPVATANNAQYYERQWSSGTQTNGALGTWASGDLFRISFYPDGRVKYYNVSQSSTPKREVSHSAFTYIRGQVNLYSRNLTTGGFSNFKIYLGKVWNGSAFVDAI